MSSHKDFDAALAEAKGGTVSFTLGGKKFEVPLPLPAAHYATLIADKEADTVPAFCDYLKKIIKPSQKKAFDKAFVDSGIDEVTLIELFVWVQEEAVGFTTKRRDSLSKKSRRTTDTTKPASRKSPQTKTSSE